MDKQIISRPARTVTVIQTRGAKTVQIELPAEVKTFGQLKQMFSANGVSYNIRENIAIESIGNSTLELDTAILPDGDFKLGIFARKTKAGADRKLLYTRIKEFVYRDGKDKVNDYFKNATGRHYTTIPNDELETLVNSYGGVAVEEVKAEEEQSQPINVIELLRKMNVSEETLKEVQNDLAGNPKSDQKWLDDICSQHPLLKC